MAVPRIIPTASLKLDDIPASDANWKKLAAFALTFDPREMGDYGQKAADLNNALANSSLAELRAHLYVEQRRWNHFGKEPEGDTMKKLREIIGLVRHKFAAPN
jgi:hypothetical protein